MHNVVMSTDWSKYPNFKKSNFQHGGPEMHWHFMMKLQTARYLAELRCIEKGYPLSYAWFVITSGSRSEKRNRQVGGKPDSTHLYGRACDIEAESSRARALIVKSLLLAGFTRIGLSKEGLFIHVDDGELILNEPGHPKDSDVQWFY